MHVLTVLCRALTLAIALLGLHAVAATAAPHIQAPEQTALSFFYDSSTSLTAPPEISRAGAVNGYEIRPHVWRSRPRVSDGFRATKVPTGGIGPVLKGQAGVRDSIAEAVARGERLRGTEVTVAAASGRRVRLDYLTEFEGRVVATEVKNGPSAVLSTRQKEIFAELEAGGGRFVGGNAERAGLSGRFPAGGIRQDFRGR